MFDRLNLPQVEKNPIMLNPFDGKLNESDPKGNDDGKSTEEKNGNLSDSTKGLGRSSTQADQAAKQKDAADAMKNASGKDIFLKGTAKPKDVSSRIVDSAVKQTSKLPLPLENRLVHRLDVSGRPPQTTRPSIPSGQREVDLNSLRLRKHPSNARHVKVRVLLLINQLLIATNERNLC